MRKIIFIIMFFTASLRGAAIDLYRPIGARAAGMGRTSVCSRDLWALQNNPAGTAYSQGWQLGLYVENQWMLKETAFKTVLASCAIPGVGCLGLNVGQFGGSKYSENKFGLVYARDFGPYLQLGMQLDFLLLHWGEVYPDRRALGVTLGLQSQLTERLRIGACLFNPLPYKKVTNDSERLPSVMRWGLTFQFTDTFVGQCEMEYDHSKQGINLRGGFEYVVLDRLSLQAGVQHQPDLLSIGVGYRIRQLHIDVAAQWHQALGASMQVGISCKLKGEK